MTDPMNDPDEEDYTFDGAYLQLARPGKEAALLADLRLCLDYLHRVQNGLTVQDLAQIGQLCDEIGERWGLGGQPKAAVAGELHVAEFLSSDAQLAVGSPPDLDLRSGTASGRLAHVQRIWPAVYETLQEETPDDAG